MFTRLLFLLVLAAAVVVPSAQTAPLPAPTGMHPFLLRADEQVTDRFPRTPSFAWNPYDGAQSYDFELATNKTFDESSIVWSTASRSTPLTVPEVAISLALPWMTGNPYALYVHVRARTASGLSRWSTPFGFNMRSDGSPESITPDIPGLARWRPVEGATSYQVWFVDAGKPPISTATNVVDEREYYTFHPDADHTSTVMWRVRAVREVYGSLPNGLPRTTYGPWSATFVSTNPPVTNGPITLNQSVSDVTGTAASPVAHALTPGFAWTGDTATNGVSGRLFRVYVATDRQCVNIVFKGSIVGSPGYAPRTSGPLALPTTTALVTSAEAAPKSPALGDGQQANAFTADLQPVTPNEWDSGAWSASSSTTTSTGGTTSPSSSSTSTGTSSILPTSPPGAKQVDLWDSGWPSGRYFWTVVPVIEVPSATTMQYFDAEVPQDACAAGRVAAFGKASEPAAASASAPYVSGLSPTGELTAAKTSRPGFYRAALIAWEPALGATRYEVQWSRTKYPWKPASATPTITSATSMLLEGLAPGVWYYRIRGIDPYIPGVVQQMTWSKTLQVTIAKPKFLVERGVTTKPVKK